MGGVSGHLWHLTENPELTFGELKDILRLASAGKLERATEKLDGQALHVTWEGGQLRAARNQNELRNGGLSLSGLAAKFRGRGSVHDAFTTAFNVLQTAVKALGRDTSDVFGARNRIVWYPIEIIYTGNPNVINYDKNSIIFHDTPIIVTDRNGNVLEEEPPGGVDALRAYVDVMQSRVTQKNWNISTPSLVSLQALSNGTVLNNALAAIDAAMNAGGIDDNSTIGDYLVGALLRNELKQLHADDAVRIALARKIAGFPGTVNLAVIKKGIHSADHKKLATEINKNKRNIIARYIEPLELAVNDFAIELLRGMQSAFVSDNRREIRRLQGELSTAIKAIERSGNDAAMTILQKQLKKLGNLENIGTPSEGIVFRYKGNFYKFTGAFAPLNQIMGIFRYGRGKAIPPMAPTRESILREYVKECIL